MPFKHKNSLIQIDFWFRLSKKNDENQGKQNNMD